MVPFYNPPRQTYTLTGLKICFFFSFFLAQLLANTHVWDYIAIGPWSSHIWALREQEIYVHLHVRHTLCSLRTIMTHRIPLIDLSTNKVSSRVKLSRVSILSFPFGDLYCINCRFYSVPLHSFRHYWIDITLNK